MIKKLILIIILLFNTAFVNAQSATASNECPSLIDYYSQHYPYWREVYGKILEIKDLSERKKAMNFADTKLDEQLDKMYGTQLGREWRDSTAKNLALNLTELMAKYIYNKAMKDAVDSKTTPINSLKREMYSLCMN